LPFETICCLNMKKVLFAIVVCLSMVLTGCKDKTISTTYTIGCLEYQYGSVQGSEWNALQTYFENNVTYNKIVTFENKTLSENDAEAVQLYRGQVAKLDKEYVCSLLSDTDFFVYGIAKRNADGTYTRLGAIRFSENGAVEER